MTRAASAPRGSPVLGLGAEAIAWIGSIGLLVVVAAPALLHGRTTIGHDNLFWFYPVYQFFAESLLAGRVPYWNPFTNGGEPFYPLLLQLRLLEPVSYLALAAGYLFTGDLVTLFNWDRVARGLVGSFGAYLLLRQWARHWLTRACLAPMVTWSSLLLTVFHQTAVVDQFVSAPFVAYFFMRLVDAADGRWRNWIGLATWLGMGWQSYYFAGACVLLFLLAGGFALFDPGALGRLARTRGAKSKAAVALAILGIMALPNAVVFVERHGFVFPARMLDRSYVGQTPLGGPPQHEPGPSALALDTVVMPYGLVEYTGTFSTPWDFLQLLAPDANEHARGKRAPGLFGKPSEAFMYVGLLGYCVVLLGIAAGRHRLKRVWLLYTSAFGLLMLGPSGGLHFVLQVFPPLWVVRHTHTFVSFFVLGLLFFFVLGCNRIEESIRGERPLFDPGSWRAGSPAWGFTALGLTASLALLAALFVEAASTPPVLPATHWEWLLVAGAFLSLWALQRRLGGAAIFAACLGAHLVVMLYLARGQGGLVGGTVVPLGVSLAFLVLAGHQRVPARWRVSAGAALALLLLADLGSYTARSSWLWHWERPDRVLRLSARPQAPGPPEPRVVVLPSTEMYHFYGQPIRYLPLAMRRPAAFSSIMYSADDPEPFFASEPLPIRNGSLDRWRIRDGLWWPEPWEVSPAGAGWPQVEPSRVQEGSASALLMRNPLEATRLHLDIEASVGLPGRWVWAALWVKSENTVPGGVEVRLDLHHASVAKAYGNSRDWERLVVGGQIGHEARPARLTATVKRHADAPALIDGVSVRLGRADGLVDASRFDLGLVRSARRWNSFLMPARYFELIHADLPDAALAEILALGKPVVQFRTDAVAAARSIFRSALRAVEPRDVGQVLERRLYLDTPAVLPRAGSGAAGAGSVRIEIHRYEYDAWDLTIDAPSDGFLYVADGFDRHWRARVDGRRREVVPANLAFKALAVPAGIHRVRLQYDPRPFRVGFYLHLGLAAVGLVALAASLEIYGNSNPRGEQDAV